MVNAVLAVFDILSNAAAGCELLLVSTAAGEANPFQFALSYDDRPVQFRGNQAVLERVGRAEGPTARAGKGLDHECPTAKR
ncbi:MAG: hypothetical protein FJX65_11305 [Alphaproteobacteria bacterium]|nr:hypothetical protein [Alphaproteobacteria bacterium]